MATLRRIMQQIICKVKVLGVIVLLTFSSGIVLRSPVVSAQTASPFQCNANYYLAQGQTDTQFNTLNVNKAPIDLAAIGSTYANGYNAIGFRVQDGFIYGYDSHSNNRYVQIASDGSVTELPASTGMTITPPASQGGYLAGDFDAEGLHNMFASTGGQNLFVITDVSSGTPDVRSTFALTMDTASVAVGDFAFNPKDGSFYGVDNLTKQVVKITINSTKDGGTLVHLPTVNDMFSGKLHGAAFIDSRGRLVTFQVDPGMIYRMNLSTGAATELGVAPTVVQYDGASCPYVPLLEKDANPRTTPENSEVTYTYTMYNPLPSTPLTFDFSDTVDQGRLYVGSTLSDTFGGTANAYGETDTLKITGMVVPQDGKITFSVKVKIPNGLAGKTVLNQAVATNFSVASLVSELRSDDPTTVIAGDPTAITVMAVNAPGTPNTGIGLEGGNAWLFAGTLSLLAGILVWLGRRTSGA